MIFAQYSFHGLGGSEVELFRRLLSGLPGVGVEIGCCDGYSTAHILDCTGLHLHSIDPFVPDSMEPSLQGSPARLAQNVAPWQDRHTLHHAYAADVAQTWDTPLDFLFLDGDHAQAAVQQDFDLWTPFLKPGGILAMHDARMSRPGGAPFHPGPSAVADAEVFDAPGWEVLGEAFSLVVARKVA